MESHRSSLQLALGGCLSLAIAMGIGRFAFTPILPLMVGEGALDPVSAGLVSSANYLGYLIGAVGAALWPLPFGAYRGFVMALACSALTTLLMALPLIGLELDVVTYSVVRFFSGLASAYTLVLASTLVLDALANRGHLNVFPVHFAGVGTGIVVSSLLIELGLLLNTDATQLWLACGVLSLLAAAGAFYLIPPAPRDKGAQASQQSSPETNEEPLPPSAYRLIAAYGCYGFGYVITATFLGIIADSLPGLSQYKTMIWGVVGLAGIPSIFIWARIGARIGNRVALCLAFLVEAVGVGLSALWPTLTGLIIAALLFGGTFIAITFVGVLEAKRLAPNSSRRIVGLMTAVFSVGQVVGPLASAALYERFGSFDGASLLGAGMLVLGALLTIKPLEAAPASSGQSSHKKRPA